MEYKEDSTRGRALMIPRNYKGDAMVQVWVDSRVLATLSRWIDEQGAGTRFMSDVVRGSLEVLAKFLVDAGSVEMIEHTKEARELLERKYRVNLNPRGRGLRNLHHNMVVSEERSGRSIGEFVRPNQRRDDVSMQPRVSGKASRIRELTEAAIARAREEEAKEQLARVKENYVADEDGVMRRKDSDVPRKLTEAELSEKGRKILDESERVNEELDKMCNIPEGVRDAEGRRDTKDGGQSCLDDVVKPRH